MLSSGLLGRHVRRRAHGNAEFREDADLRRVQPCLLALGHQLGKPEVQHLDEAVRADHHVLGLDVAMNDADVVGSHQRGGDLERDVERLPGLETTCREPLTQRLPFHVLHRDVVLPVG